MDDLNNGQAQGVLANMLQHLQEATPDSEKPHLRGKKRTNLPLCGAMTGVIEWASCSITTGI
jgi:hypothetical protein